MGAPPFPTGPFPGQPGQINTMEMKMDPRQQPFQRPMDPNNPYGNSGLRPGTVPDYVTGVYNPPPGFGGAQPMQPGGMPPDMRGGFNPGGPPMGGPPTPPGQPGGFNPNDWKGPTAQGTSNFMQNVPGYGAQINNPGGQYGAGQGANNPNYFNPNKSLMGGAPQAPPGGGMQPGVQPPPMNQWGMQGGNNPWNQPSPPGQMSPVMGGQMTPQQQQMMNQMNPGTAPQPPGAPNAGQPTPPPGWQPQAPPAAKAAAPKPPAPAAPVKPPGAPKGKGGYAPAPPAKKPAAKPVAPSKGRRKY